MTKFSKILLTAAVAVGIFAAHKAAALSDQSEFILNTMNGAASISKLGSELKQANIVVATWDAGVVSNRSVGAHALGVHLPKNSVLLRTFIRIITPVTHVGVGTTSTLAFSCEDANNIFTATDLRKNQGVYNNSASTFIDGATSGAISTFRGSIAADCVINATVGGDAASTGKVNAFIQYVVTP